MVLVVTALATAFVQRTLLSAAPRSFSLGEAAFVTHGVILLFYTPHSYKQQASEETSFLQVIVWIWFVVVGSETGLCCESKSGAKIC